MIAQSRSLFQADFWRTNATLLGHLARNESMSRSRKVAKLPITNWGNNGCKSGLSQINPT
jgi:hypothetical protein